MTGVHKCYITALAIPGQHAGMALAHLVGVGSDLRPAAPSFEKAIEDKDLLVDKSAFIEKVLKRGTPGIITRPRRFGKTYALHLLKMYVEMDYSKDACKKSRKERMPKHFEEFQIFGPEHKELEEEYFQSSPVLHLDFIETGDAETFVEMCENLNVCLRDECLRHLGNFKSIVERDEVQKAGISSLGWF